MLIHGGTQEQLLAEAPTGAGSRSVEGSIDSDSVLISLWVGSVTAGDLTVTVYTLTDAGKEVEIISFPVVSAPTVELLLRKAAISLQKFRVQVDYTGACSFEIYARAVSGGESSARILGSDSWTVTQATVGTLAVELIPAALTDRQGLVLKNWSGTQTIYVAESLVKAAVGTGYPLAPKDALALDIAAGASVYAVSDGAGADIRIAQAGA